MLYKRNIYIGICVRCACVVIIHNIVIVSVIKFILDKRVECARITSRLSPYTLCITSHQASGQSFSTRAHTHVSRVRVSFPVVCSASDRRGDLYIYSHTHILLFVVFLYSLSLIVYTQLAIVHIIYAIVMDEKCKPARSDLGKQIVLFCPGAITCISIRALVYIRREDYSSFLTSRPGVCIRRRRTHTVLSRESRVCLYLVERQFYHRCAERHTRLCVRSIYNTRKRILFFFVYASETPSDKEDFCLPTNGVNPINTRISVRDRYINIYI